MVRPPTFDSNGIKRGAWSKKEDDILRAFILESGHHNWRRLPRLAGLPRCGKSCRLRWVNYLQPGLKRGKITKDEEDIIIKLHDTLGPKWSAIAAALPGRTDNAIKNYWHAHIKKRNGRGNRKIISSFSFPSETSSPLHVPIPSSSSSETSSSVTTDIKELKQLFAQDQDDDLIGLGYDHTCLSQFDVDFGMFLEMKYEHKSTISSSLDSTIAYFWSEPFEEDIVDMVLW